jgi:hypothetical protein
VQGSWFPNHLLLEGTSPYPDFLGRNRWLVVTGVQDPNSTGTGIGTSNRTIIQTDGIFASTPCALHTSGEI